MRNSPFINPTVKTFETDLSDKPSAESKTTSKPVGKAPSGEPLPGGGGIPTPPQINNFMLLEDGFFLLKEDNYKIIL